LIKIGINGFGRIGRSLARLIIESDDYLLVAVNDIENDIDNLAYLLEFDSIYGTLGQNVEVENDKILVKGNKIKFYSFSEISDVPWEKNEVDIVIEATGLSKNVISSRQLIDANRVKRIVVTNNDKNVDHTIMMSVNQSSFNPSQHFVISGSICDANAIAPALKVINDSFGLQSVLVTTLHPWLSYQNLLDGPVSSISNPGHNWKDYSLGRSSIGNLIIKETTAAEATVAVLPSLKDKIQAVSFRVPTNNVAVSDLSLYFNQEVSLEGIYRVFEDAEILWPNIIKVNKLSLVSGDFSKLKQTCVIEKRFIKLIDNKHLKIIIWYDNEWAFCNRILDLCTYVTAKEF
jgi:glyceraldehyde 3-phosphate dehydrogenase